MLVLVVGATEVGDLSRDVRRGEMPAITVLVGERKTSALREVLSVGLWLGWGILSTFTFQNKRLKGENSCVKKLKKKIISAVTEKSVNLQSIDIFLLAFSVVKMI